MKALFGPCDNEPAPRHLRSALTRPLLILGLVSLLVLALATGCSVVEELTTTTTLAVAGFTTSTDITITASTAGSATTSTLAPSTTTTVVEQTTTTDQTTSTTTPAPSTSTTVTIPLPAGPPSLADSPSGTVLYEITDWSSGISGWAAAGQWKTVDGMLVTDGSSDSFAVAPVDLTDYPDYAVECEIQILDPEAGTDAVLMARMINGVGLWGGYAGSEGHTVIGHGDSETVTTPFMLDGGWHKYRLEVRGNTVKLFFEQAEVARASDNRALEPGTVGIYCAHGQINVRSFRVIAL